MRTVFDPGRGARIASRVLQLAAFAALTKAIAVLRSITYVGSVAAVNLAVGWTLLGVSGCHGGCCCAL